MDDSECEMAIMTLNMQAIELSMQEAAAKALAKELLLGRERTITGRLSKAEGKMGRSLIIDLNTNGYGQIDHRTLKWIIIDNVKYTVKK